MPAIDRRLNLVIPVDHELPDRRKSVREVETERRVTDTGHLTKMYVHHMPASREILDAHFRVLSRMMTVVATEHHNVLGNPGMSSLLFRDVAMEMGRWDGADGVAATLMPELRRLTNVLYVDPNGAGWKTAMFQTVIDEQLLDAEEVREIEGFLVFFTTVLSSRPVAELRAAQMGFALQSGTQCTASTLAEFRTSLPILTATEVIPLRAPLSSIAV